MCACVPEKPKKEKTKLVVSDKFTDAWKHSRRHDLHKIRQISELNDVIVALNLGRSVTIVFIAAEKCFYKTQALSAVRCLVF
jgi:hypothetical protein